MSLTCDEESRRVNAERYATGRMSAVEAAAFEDHFVTCAECQSEVRLASAIATGLAQTPRSESGSRRRIWIWAATGLALAAALALMVVPRRGARSEIAVLGAVSEPPSYLGIQVRGAGAPADSVFEAAMDSYAKGQYGKAAARLRAVLATGRDSVPAQFFLAASLLFDNKPSEAADVFQRVIALGDTPYLAEARYYRAKALLRLGRPADAQAELSRLTDSGGVVFEMGKALADSIAQLRAR